MLLNGHRNMLLTQVILTAVEVPFKTFTAVAVREQIIETLGVAEMWFL